MAKKQSMKVVITGALGHIGSYLIRDLPFRFPGVDIVMIDNMMTQRYPSLFDLPREVATASWKPTSITSICGRYSRVRMQSSTSPQSQTRQAVWIEPLKSSRTTIGRPQVSPKLALKLAPA
jgi:hypothetical protein